MSIRLNKAIRELNIGLQTAVEFLKKRSDLGEVRDDVSFKLNDDQYHALVEEFKSDKEVRSQAEKLFPKHQKEKKRTSERKEQKPGSPVREATTQKYTVLGKIDLDSLNRKPSQKPRQEQSAGSAQDAPASSSAASHAPSAAAPKQPAAAEPKPVQKAVAKPEAASQAGTAQAAAAGTAVGTVSPAAAGQGGNAGGSTGKRRRIQDIHAEKREETCSQGECPGKNRP